MAGVYGPPSADVLAERIRVLAERHNELEQRLSTQYLDKHELQAEYLARADNERALAWKISKWGLIAAVAVSATSVGTFGITLLVALHVV